ncbi:MAG: ABC transporter substrate-binding protein [Hyphomicrobiales bacterium]|nr:ABC transporter substrate-binding protein [Hyphomicrobiales bacterium]
MRMMPTVLTIAATAWLATFAQAGLAQTAVPAAVRQELVPTGTLRAGINLGNSVLAQRSAAGELGGVSVELARELGKRLGVPVELVVFKAAGQSFAAMAANKIDIAFFAIEPKRAAEVAFTPPYVLIEGAYMVAKDSPLLTPADVDRPGIRVGVGLGSAYDLYLTRTLKNATIVRAKVGGGQASIDLYYAEKLDAAAGVRQPLVAHAKTDPGVRVMQQRFMEIAQAMGLPQRRPAASRYLRDFIEEMKSSGFVAAALKRSGQDPALVAPAAGN